MARKMEAREEAPTRLNEIDAKQASPRKDNYRVFVFSMLLALGVAGLVYYKFYGSWTPQPPAATERPAGNKAQ